MALINKLTAIADAIREKTGTTEPMTLDSMATAISGITGGGGGVVTDYIPESAFTISGDCQYRFSENAWNWFIEKYGDRITTENLNYNFYRMFYNSDKLINIPFEIKNIKNSTSYGSSLSEMFCNCLNLISLPKINNCLISDTNSMFEFCLNLREIPSYFYDTWDWSFINKQTSEYNSRSNNIFNSCYSLRSLPIEMLKHQNSYINYSYSLYYNGFRSCYALDEIVDLPCPFINVTWGSNAFSYTFRECGRLKNMTFALQEDGTPYEMKWKSQTIDLSSYVGYANSTSYILNYNSGITADKRVTDDATYQALKDDPDWFTTDIAYSRYNHNSAVATINSLPDTSAYLASAGGTNTIKFKGASGSATDGGAINTLTEEEIAVATAKGWTVTLV